MRSILFLLILVMIGLNGKGQSVTALPDSVLSQCCLEVTLLNGNVTTVDWVFIQYVTRDGTGTKLFVEYAPNFGGIQWETQIRIQDDFDDVIERSKFIILPFTVGSTDYGINRNWIANIEENTTTGGTWIYGRFGTPTKRKFSAVEDYETLKNLLLACRPRAIVVAENGLYTEGDTVRMGGFLIENTSITTEGYNWQMKDTLSSAEFGIDYVTPETGDTTVYWARRSGRIRQMLQMGNKYYYNVMKDTVGGLYSDFTHSWASGDPLLKYVIFNPSDPNSGTAWFQIQKNNGFLVMSNETTNPYYTPSFSINDSNIQIGVNESGSGDPGNGVGMGAYGLGTTEYLYMITKGVDDNTATTGQFLQLIDETSGEVDFATIDPVDSSLYATRYWTSSNFFPLAGGTLTGTTGNGFLGLPAQSSTPSASASGFRMFANGAHNLAIIDRNGWITTFDISTSANRDFTYPSTGGTFALGTGTPDRSARWSGTNTLDAGSWDDNLTRLRARVPVQFQSWTTAGRPTGTDGYYGKNTTTGFLEGYYTSQWENLISSSGAVANQVAIFSSAGKISGDLKLDYTNSQLRSSSVATTGFNPVYQIRAPSGLAANSAYGITYNVVGYGSKAAMMFNGNNSGGVADIDFYTTNDFAPGTDGVFFSNNLNRLRIARNGQILIGTTTSTFGDKVEINGDLSNSTFRTISGSIFRMRANSTTVRFVGPGWGTGARFVINAGSSDFNGFGQTGAIPNIDFNQGGGTITTDFIPGSKNNNSPLYITWNTNGTPTFTQQRFHKFDTLGLAIGGTSVIRPLTVTGAARITGSAGTPSGILGRDGNGDLANLTLGTNLSITGGTLNAVGGTDTHFANTNLTATGNRTHDWANYNFTWTNMKKFMWGADSLFKITKEFSGYTYSVLRNPSGQSLLDIQGDDDAGSNSAEIRLTDTETGNIVFIAHDDRGFGSDGFRMEHYNGSNYHNMLFVDKTSRLFHVNNTENSSGTMFQADASILDGLLKNIVRGAAVTTNTDTINATHFFRTENNLTKNRDIFGVYSKAGAIDTMYFRLDKVGGLHQYKKAYLHGLGTGTAIDLLGRTSTNEIVPVSLSGFADGNGIYGGSGTLSGNTVVDADGHSLDVENLTELNFYSEGGNGSLGFTDEVFRVESDTMVNLSTTSGGEIEIKEGVRMVGKVQAKQEAYYEITSTSSPQTFSSDISDNYVNQGGTQASFTFLFPATPADGQILMITWGNAISVVTLDGNGNTITGTAVTTAVAGTRRMFKYYDSSGEWVKIF